MASRRPRVGELLAAGLALALVHPAAVDAQRPPLVAGLVSGYTLTEHAWSPDADTESVAGFLFGGFVDVQTPLSWLTAGVELAYTQRGSDVLLDVGGTPSPGGIRTDYLSFAVRLRAALPLGPARVHVVAGPMSELVVRSRLDPLLIQILDEEGAAPFGVQAGAGIGLWVTDDLFAEIEGRVVRGLQSAYAGDLISATSRSVELVARAGFLVGP